MPLIQILFSAIITTLFLIFVFLLSWYIALPLLVIWAFWGLARFIRDRIQLYRLGRSSNGCTFRQTSGHDSKTTIIDADYTEIN